MRNVIDIVGSNPRLGASLGKRPGGGRRPLRPVRVTLRRAAGDHDVAAALAALEQRRAIRERVLDRVVDRLLEQIE